MFSDVTHCDGLAWDWVNKRLYWTDAGDNTVNRLSRDGYSKEVLFHEEADLPRDIVLMPCDGYMYWRVWQGTKSSIKHATMDGLNPKIIIETVGWPNGLAVDKDENQLFWADTRPNRIESSDLDGNNRKIILQADNLYILAISLYNNYIYFTDLVTKSLMRVEKKGNGHQELLDGGLNRYPKGIRIFSKSKQNCTRTLCHKDITRCTDICMPSNNLVHCSCPINKTLTDGYRCIQTAKAGLNCSDTMTSFICSDESKCISKASICDGYYDCFDGSDEQNCTSQSTIFPSTSLSLSYQTSLPTSTVFKPSKSTMEFSLKTSSAIHQSTADKDSSATLYSSSISPSTSTMTSSSSSVITSNHSSATLRSLSIIPSTPTMTSSSSSVTTSNHSSATLHSSSISPSTSTMTSSSSSVTTSNHSSATLHSSSISPSTSTMTSSSSSVTTSNHSATLHSSSISPSTSTMASSSSSVTTSNHSSAKLHSSSISPSTSTMTSSSSSVTTSNHSSATLHSSSISPSTSTMTSSSSSVTTSNHSATLHSSSISPSTSTMASSSSSVTTSNHSSATLHSSSISPSTSTMTSSSSSVTTSNHSATLHSSSISPSTSTMTSSSSSVITSNHSSATLHSSSISPSTSTMTSSSSSVITSNHSSATLHSSSISPSTSTMTSSSSSVTTSNHSSATLHSSSISPSTSTMTSSSSSVTTIRTTPASNASACDLDLGFVIDESGSISFDEFRKSIDFVRNITQYFTIATARTRVSLITYGTDAVLHFKFNDDAGSDQSAFLDYISTINGRGGGTNTYAALKMSNLEMFNTENGDRTDKVNVLIVLTDGRSSGRSQLISESNALRESGVKVLAVGVGSGVGEEELNIIAGNSLNVFNVSDASHLSDIIEEIVPISCNEQMLELECQSYGFKAGFSLSGLQSKNLPYTIRFSGSNDCGTINKTSSDHLSNGRIWMWTNYTSCGVEAYHVGDSIAFEKTLMVNYGSKDHSSVVYRYISSSYKVKCFLDRKVVQKLEINVQDVIESNPDINGTSDFKFNLKIMDANNEGNEVQLANVGDRLKFVLNLENAPNQVKASPQNCYATKPDGSGRYNLISNRCVDPNEETTFITSPSNELHYFSWELLAFRYFGESNSVVIVCEVLICKNEPFWNLSEQCKRCDQTSNRKRRDVDVDDEVLQKTTVSSQPLFLIERSPKEPGQSNQQNGFLAKPEGISILVVLAVVVLLSGIVHLKKKFWPSRKAMSKKTLNVGAVDEKGFENLAME
ncbi:serine-rich adhesin for platelets-like [Clytia hemisphaerica]|uniref:serine-rich adhesin for platelets-like n=1 Tax=Clytia hemisphaerica TaxID=252671 RepID=UPI0034D779A5